jgi:protein tyrosine/serine phosphatase
VPCSRTTWSGKSIANCLIRRGSATRFFLWLTFFALAGTGSIWSAGARGLPAQEGILNFGKISEHLYRGAQPDATGIKNLKKLGVKLIVNLRMEGDGWKDEAAEAVANGIVYTNFPMSGAARPKDEQVRQILALFESFSGPIFVHCRHGCDRTGTIVACYRIQHDRWPGQLAMQEAKHYGISRLEILLKRYVANFARVSKPGLYADLRQARAN